MSAACTHPHQAQRETGWWYCPTCYAERPWAPPGEECWIAAGGGDPIAESAANQWDHELYAAHVLRLVRLPDLATEIEAFGSVSADWRRDRLHKIGLAVEAMLAAMTSISGNVSGDVPGGTTRRSDLDTALWAVRRAAKVNARVAAGDFAEARHMRLYPDEAAGIAAGALWAFPEDAS